MKTFTVFLFAYCVALAYGEVTVATETLKIIQEDVKNSTKNEEDIEDRLAARAESVAPGEYPYQVSIQVNGRHSCGGSLISSTHVLTAAHCIDKFVQNPFMGTSAMTVEVGSVTIGRGKSHRVKRLAHMPGFTTEPVTPFFIPNDVAVITLHEPVNGSNNVKIITLPSSDPPVGAKVVVTGFGNAKFGGPPSPILKKTELHIVSTEECDAYYAANTRLRVTGSHICAKRGSGYGTCQGDSGGPMMYNRQIVGLVSGGTGRCGEGGPDVFTRVTHYLPFIKQEMSNPTDSSGGSAAVEDNGFEPSYPGLPPGYPQPQQEIPPTGIQWPPQYPPQQRYPPRRYPPQQPYPPQQYPPQNYPPQYPPMRLPPGWEGIFARNAPMANETST